MKKITLLLISLCCILILQAQIRFAVPDTFSIQATAQQQTLTIPLQLEKKLQKTVALKYNYPVFMQLNNCFDSIYMTSCRLMLIKGENPYLLFTIQTDQLRQPGTYKGLVAFTDRPGGTTIHVPFSLIRPFATLDTVSTVYIHISDSDIKEGNFDITETSGRSRVAALQMALWLTLPGQQQLLTFPATPYVSEANTNASLKYSLNKEAIANLPRGVTRGKIKVSAPELVAPLFVPVEITKTRSKCWIVILILAGLLAGFCIRHFLQDKKDHENAKTKLYEVMEKIRRATSNIEDSKLKKGVKTIMEELLLLTTASPGRWKARNKAIEEALNKATTDYAALKTDWETRMNIANTQLQGMSSFFEKKDREPYITTSLQEAYAKYDMAVTALSKNDAVTASARLNSIIQIATTFVTSYTQQITPLVTALGTAGQLYPSGLNVIPDLISNVLAEINRLLAQPPAPETATTSQSLLWANTLEANVQAALATICHETEKAFKAGFIADNSPQMNAFQAAYIAWSAAFSETQQNHNFSQVPAAAARLQNTWQQPQARFGGPQQAGAAPTPAVANQPDAEGYYETTILSLETIQTLQQAAAKNWWIYALLQTILLALIICMIAYKYYAPGFIGTTDELINIFLFAFAIDVTTDKVLALKSNING
ncbi:hypothetical protein HNQ91_002007 [Filimonas zeae]|uniref:Oxygen tolerance n=1 Tax=Filimonas zeae TaxID=1737353 RepID=A0A917MV67_9BACT|nr:hypothetical protein [Filimonas zeae]MDR6338956.1 hypothetical protein [Filimonas zeae]GGH65785.1 hypothetical protein GCM10011379_19300 [Filimonas zeae]